MTDTRYSWTFAITEHLVINGQEITTTRGIEANGQADHLSLIADTLEYELAQRIRTAADYADLGPSDPA